MKRSEIPAGHQTHWFGRGSFRLGWALVCLLCFSSIASFAASEDCYLTLDVVGSSDPFFQIQAQVAAYRLGESRRLQQIDLIAGKPEPLECGTYVLKVRPSSGDFRTVSRVVVLRHGLSRSVTVGVPLQVGDEEVGEGEGGDGLDIRGRVQSEVPFEHGWWVQLHGLTLPYRREVSVDSQGYFEILDLDMGKYILLLIQGTTVKSLKQVEVDLTSLVTSVQFKLFFD